MTQRTWLITGANSGFGRQMTEQLLASGDRFAGTVRQLNAMDDLKDAYGDLLWLARLDTAGPAGHRRGVRGPRPDRRRGQQCRVRPVRRGGRGDR
jgi:NAD(P)-dependent dehydrogenase (short-subunit alcohol dehydrogenase family)